MNEIALESFISYCDDMMIANESLDKTDIKMLGLGAGALAAFGGATWLARKWRDRKIKPPEMPITNPKQMPVTPKDAPQYYSGMELHSSQNGWPEGPYSNEEACNAYYKTEISFWDTLGGGKPPKLSPLSSEHAKVAQPLVALLGTFQKRCKALCDDVNKRMGEKMFSVLAPTKYGVHISPKNVNVMKYVMGCNPPDPFKYDYNDPGVKEKYDNDFDYFVKELIEIFHKTFDNRKEIRTATLYWGKDNCDVSPHASGFRFYWELNIYK